MLAKNEYVKALPSESEALDNYIPLRCRQCILIYFALNIRPIIIAHDPTSYWTFTEFSQTWTVFSYCIAFVYDSPETWNISILINSSRLPFQEVSIDYQLPSLLPHAYMGLMPLLPLMFILSLYIPHFNVLSIKL